MTDSHELVRVPLGGDAPDEAREQVARWGQLFPPTALRDRLALVEPFLAREGLGESVLRPVRHSLMWGTAAEVAIRLMPHNLAARDMTILDALSCITRLARGLAERRGRDGTALARGVEGAALRMLDTYGPQMVADPAAWTSSWVRARQALLCGDPEWGDGRIESLLAAQPLALAIARVVDAEQSPLPAAERCAQAAHLYASVQWLARDLHVLVDGHSSSTRGPVSDAIAVGLHARSVTERSVHLLDRTTQALKEVIETEEFEGLHDDIKLYAHITVDFAASTYAALSRAGMA